MLIKNVDALVGEELKYVRQIDIRIRDGKFVYIGSNLRQNSKEERADCEGLVAVPGFVNCHTHLGDSIAKDVFLNGSADKRIHPVSGIKPRILGNTSQEHLASFMRNSCISMMRRGITTFADFREDGIRGIRSLRNAISGLPIRPIILGRLDMYCDQNQIRHNMRFPRNMEPKLDELLSECDGLGISGANENSTPLLNRYSRTPKLRAIHSAETQQSVRTSKKITGRSEPARALKLRPHFLVHMTHATAAELRAVARHSAGIVVCPRANASLAEGIPDIELMAKSGCIIGLGTDNVMINSPDMFREMDYLWKVTMGMHKRQVEPREILKMATINGGKILCRNIGAIKQGMLADCLFLDKHALDLEPMHNPYASIVHRAGGSSVRAVMIGGELAYGRI